jgi:hypothetical protein
LHITKLKKKQKGRKKSSLFSKPKPTQIELQAHGPLVLHSSRSPGRFHGLAREMFPCPGLVSTARSSSFIHLHRTATRHSRPIKTAESARPGTLAHSPPRPLFSLRRNWAYNVIWGASKEDNDTAVGPLAGVCIHQWVNTPPSSGSTAGLYYVRVPLDQEVAASRRRRWTTHRKRLLPVRRCASTTDGGTPTRRWPKRTMVCSGFDPS